MNGLSLRINAVKNDKDPKKSGIDLVQINIEGRMSGEVKKQIELINNAVTSEAQFNQIKKLSNLIVEPKHDQIDEATKKLNDEVASCLTRMYFREKTKHPVKSIIQSCLNHPHDGKGFLLPAIQQVIVEEMNAIDLSSTVDCFHFISCLNEASQNFKLLMTAIVGEVSTILPFIFKLVQVYDEQLKTELSPAQKNEISHQLHCCLQAVIFCFKNRLTLLPWMAPDFGPALLDISLKCLEFIEHPDLPMDTKNISAIIVVMRLKRMNKSDDYMNWIKDESLSYEKRLSIIFGIITTMDQVESDILDKVSTVLKQIYLETSVDPTLLMSVSRSFMQLTKNLAAQNFRLLDRKLKSVIESALSVALLSIDHHMDNVRHIAKETLKNLVEVGNNCNSNLQATIFDEIQKFPSLNLQCVIIVSICPVITAQSIFRKRPGFLREILVSLTEDKVANQNLVNCYEAVAAKLYDETEFDKWFNRTVKEALTVMFRREEQGEESEEVKNILIKLIKKYDKVLEEMLKQRETFDVGFLLMCLSAEKKAGRYDKRTSTDDQWKGVIGFDEIKNAMVHIDDKVRTSAFLLIVETRKSTEGFTAQELECAHHFFKYNINVQSPATRQNILGMIKNLFARIQAVLQIAIKKNQVESLEFYFKFLAQLQEFAIENLVEGANFTRRNLSLLLLRYISEIFRQSYPLESAKVWNQHKFNLLMGVMHDSYEANKEKVIEIMKLIPSEVVRQFCQITLEQLRAAVTSVRPPDSLTALYLMELFTSFTLNFDDFPTVRSEKSSESFVMLTWCEELLLTGLDLAEKSLTVASSTNPLYGLVQSIRHLLSKLDLNTLGSCHLWRDFFKRLIHTCTRLTQVVAPVVNNSSPEGILPDEDFEYLDATTREEWTRIAAQTTPQMVLLCSWRTVKEVSLLLGEICMKAPIISEDEGLLDVHQIISIGDHFLELLAKTKHRGAFEQCYFGFSQLCLRLWTCNEPELHKLPSEMLHQMISSISGDNKNDNELLSMKNLCATRRSAGLPFMIQALITSELKVSSNKNFHFVMKSLIQFSRHGEYLETRTHSLNILRALFRCSDLNEAIGEYISDGIKCAILGYGAESWIEKNSSTLLFSALMVRIFGVQRSKDSEDLNIKNKMRARIFFLRYPDLYDFFMTQLKEAAQFVLRVKMNSKLQPILLLLNRLYPSALEGTQTKLELVKFVPVVSLCSGCVELPTRVLCAKFIANVTPPHLLIERILERIKVLKESERIPANVAHGILLQILYLVKLVPAVDNISSLTPVLDEVCLIGLRFKDQLICFGAYVDIVVEVSLKCWLVIEYPRDDSAQKWLQDTTGIPEKTLKFIQELHKNPQLQALVSPQHLSPQNDHKKFLRYLETCFDYDKSAPFGSSVVSPKISLVKLMTVNLYGSAELFKSFDSQSTAENDLDFKLNVILLLLDFDYATSMQEEYEIDPKVVFLVKNMGSVRRSRLRQEIMMDQELKNGFGQIKLDYISKVKHIDVMRLVYYSEESNGECALGTAKDLITTSLRQPEQLKKSLLKLANVIVKTVKLSPRLDFEFLLEISTDSSYFVKLAASDFIETIALNLKGIQSHDTALYFAKSLLLLLMDDEPDVRQRNAKLVMDLAHTNERNVIPLYAQELFIEFLLEELENFDKFESMALVMLIVVDGGDSDNCLDENITEYRVFDKKEVNIFSETFMVKRVCSDALRKKLQGDQDVARVISASQKFSACCDVAAIEGFLRALL